MCEDGTGGGWLLDSVLLIGDRLSTTAKLLHAHLTDWLAETWLTQITASFLKLLLEATTCALTAQAWDELQFEISLRMWH